MSLDLSNPTGGVHKSLQGEVYPIVEPLIQTAGGDFRYESWAPFHPDCRLSTVAGFSAQRENSLLLKKLEFLCDFAWQHRHDGWTVNIDGYVPQSGYVVSLAGCEERIEPVSYAKLYKYAFDNRRLLRNDFIYFGGWVDGNLCLDCSTIFDNEESALQTAAIGGQDAIYDLTTQRTIFVPK